MQTLPLPEVCVDEVDTSELDLGQVRCICMYATHVARRGCERWEVTTSPGIGESEIEE